MIGEPSFNVQSVMWNYPDYNKWILYKIDPAITQQPSLILLDPVFILHFHILLIMDFYTNFGFFLKIVWQCHLSWLLSFLMLP